MAVNLNMTVADARADLTRNLADGVICPCCDQTAREYKRALTSVAARALIALWRTHRHNYGHLPTVAREHLADVNGQGGYLNLAAHWCLMISDPDRAGYWAVTGLGERWLHGRATVPKYAVIYNGRPRGLTGPPCTVRDALGTHFDLDTLLGPRRTPDPEPLHLFPPDNSAPLEQAA